MKQTSNLPLVGKKMTKESMKVLKGGVSSGDCLDMGWACDSSCCYDDPYTCRAACGRYCMEAICML
jgi:hypothetical protein